MTPVPPEVPAPTINDKNIALIRTIVPVAVGFALVTLANWLRDKYGWEADFSAYYVAAAGAAVTIVTGLYYRIVRWLETNHPKAGWLLGYPSPPVYNQFTDDVIEAALGRLGYKPPPVNGG